MSEDKEINGVPEGVSANDVPVSQDADLGDTGVPQAPEVSNKAPVKEEPKDKVEDKVDDKPKEPEDTPADKVEDNVDQDIDDVMTAAVNLLKEADISEDEADTWFDKVKETNDINDLDTNTIIEKLGKDKAALVISAIKADFTKTKAETDLKINSTYEAVGGKEQFDTIKDWSLTREKTDPDFATEMNQYREMINLGEHSAKLAGKAMLDAYNTDPSNTTLDNSIVQGDKLPGNGTETLTRAEYVTQRKAAELIGDTVEINRLKSVRARSL